MTFQKRKLQTQIVSLANSTQYLKIKVTPILPNLFEKIEEITFSHFMRPALSQLQQRTETEPDKKLQNNTSHEQPCKNLQQNTSKSNLAAYKKNKNVMTKWGLSQECKTGSTLQHQLSPLTTGTDQRNHMITSVGAEKHLIKCNIRS